MKILRGLATVGLAASLVLGSGCTTTGVILGVAGVATDTSITWSVVKHLHAQLVEGDPRPCVLLNSVQRALAPRCGAFVPGSLVAADLERTGFAECTLTLATRDPHLWPVLPELLERGARTSACTESPLVQLAVQQACPDFSRADAPVLAALRHLAEVDARSVHHDSLRLLSCPSARAAGLDSVIATWRERGRLQPGRLGFSPLGALHPDALNTTLGRALEADGHRARAALGAYQGSLRPGFEEALRTSHWAALEWWLARVPELVQRVPPTQGNQLAWLPLARVLVPSFLAHPQSQQDMVEFLLARGADPRQTLPSDPAQSVTAYARLLRSPMLALLETPPAPRTARLAAASPDAATHD